MVISLLVYRAISLSGFKTDLGPIEINKLTSCNQLLADSHPSRCWTCSKFLLFTSKALRKSGKITSNPAIQWEGAKRTMQHQHMGIDMRLISEGLLVTCCIANWKPTTVSNSQTVEFPRASAPGRLENHGKSACRCRSRG